MRQIEYLCKAPPPHFCHKIVCKEGGGGGGVFLGA